MLQRVGARQLAKSGWAPRLAASFALGSLVGRRPDPWRVNAGPGSGKLLLDGFPVARLAQLGTTVLRVEVLPGEVEVEALFYRYATPDVDLVMSGPSGRTLRAVESVERAAAMADKFGRFVSSAASYRRFRIPIEDGDAAWTLSILNERTAQAEPCLKVTQGVRSPFVSTKNFPTRFNVNGGVRLQGNRTLLVSRHTPRRWRYSVGTVRRLRRDGHLALERLVATDDKDVLLITDRPRYGDDNGEALFRYIQRERPDLRRRTWLVLHPDAPSYPELRRTGRVVHPRSRHHRMLYINAQILFSSHNAEVYNNPFYPEPRERYADVTDFTFVWLQHGILMNSADSVLSRFRRGHDGVVIGGRHELAFASRPELGIGRTRLLDTGLPRFDLLHDAHSERPTLLYMPTWRFWLVGERQPDGTSLPLEGFEDEDYYQHHAPSSRMPGYTAPWSELMRGSSCCCHPTMRAYQHLYQRLASDRVIVHSPGAIRYRDAFARGTAMLTDYSSVFADFAYLGKPVLFDHTDFERFRAEHYRHGLFDYETAAPGPVLRSLEELVAGVCELADRGFVPEPTDSARTGDMFLHRDRGNSARVLQRALALDERRRAGDTLS